MTVFVADQVSDNKKRLAELELEAEMRDNFEKASGPWLDMHGERIDMKRNLGETDYSYRGRLRTKLA